MIFITDPHGCANTLLRLLQKCPSDDLVLGGDLIDRGPNSAAIVRYAMEHNIPTVMGNHEEMCLDYYRGDRGGWDIDQSYRQIWLNNGGNYTRKSFGGEVPEDVLDWMQNLPLFIKYDDGLLVSHTGHGLAPKPAALWDRSFQFPRDGYYRVFGHTPHKEPYAGTNYICTDTGCVFPDRGYGKLTAFLWPERQIIQQNYDETPL